VAPVHRKGARGRRVWFPPGQWSAWWEGRTYEGPGWHEVPAPLEAIPLFRREGGHVPLAEEPDPRLEGVGQADRAGPG
jgi:alpha-glucosidase (family GH31 glycosyl hydrolase)